MRVFLRPPSCNSLPAASVPSVAPIVVDDAIRPVTSGLESSWNSGTMYKRGAADHAGVEALQNVAERGTGGDFEAGFVEEGLAGGIVIAVEEWMEEERDDLDCLGRGSATTWAY